MAATLVIPVGITGLTLTCDLFPDGSDTADASAQSLTEATNRKGYYTASITGLTGLKFVNVKNGSTVIGYGYVVMDSSGTQYLEDERAVANELAADRAQPGQAAPAATATMAEKVDDLHKAWRNKSTQTATDYKLFNDDAATVDAKATCSDDGTTFTRGEMATGP